MAFKFREEDAPGFKFREEDKTPAFKFKAEDSAKKPIPLGEGKAAAISQGRTTKDAIMGMLTPYMETVKAQFEPLPGTQWITRKAMAPIRAPIEAVKRAAAGEYGPTMETLSSPLKTAAEVGSFAGEAFAEGGIAPIDIWTLGGGKFLRTGTDIAEAGARLAFKAKAESSAAAAMTQKRIEANTLKAVSDKSISPQLGAEIVKSVDPLAASIPGVAEEVAEKTATLSNPLPYYRQAVAATDALGKTFKESLETISQKKLDDIVMYEKDPQKKISDFIFDRIEDGSLDPIDAAKILGVEMKKAEAVPALIERLKASRTAFGQGLNRYSQAARALEPYLERDAKMRNALNKALSAHGPESAVGQVFRPIYELSGKAINAWRGLLTSQVSTAMANVISQTGRYSIGTVTDAFSGLGRAALGMEPLAPSMANAVEDILSIGRAFKKDGLDKTLSVLDKYPVHKQMIDSKFFGEAGLNQGLMKFVTFLNTTQERFFRTVAFDARLRGNLRRIGYSAEDLPALMANPKNAKSMERLINDATKHALELTFAAQPTSKTANAVLRFYQQMPILYTLTTPFPRFMMNSAKFVTEHSPLGLAFMKAGKGSAKYNVETASKIMVGSMMMAGGLALRGSKYAGPNWYEVRPDPDRKPNEVVSLQNQGPLMATTFMADLIDRTLQVRSGERRTLGYTPNDIAKAMYSIQRSDITMMPLLDNLVFSKTELLENDKKFMKIMQEQANNFIGGFSTPVKSVRDIANWDEPMERKNTRQVNLYGQFADSFPGWRDSLPTAYSATRPGPQVEENTHLKQLMGTRTIKRTDFERVLEELQIKPFEWNKPTGSRYVDNVVNERLGNFMPGVMEKIISSPMVQKAPTVDDKRIIVLTWLRKFSNTQRKIVLDSNPTLRKMLEKTMPAQRKYEAALAGVDPVTWEKME